MSTYYKLASDGVIWEKIGDQIVMANLNSGRYSNISESSGLVAWELMMMGASHEDIHQYLSEYFTHYDEGSRAQIDFHIQKLIKLEFVSLVPHAENSTSLQTMDKKKSGGVFVAPKLLIYDDIDTLLQLDPIDDEVEELMKELN